MTYGVVRSLHPEAILYMNGGGGGYEDEWQCFHGFGGWFFLPITVGNFLLLK